MTFKDVSNKPNFVATELEVLQFWQDTNAFNELRRLRAASPTRWSFLDGPITANNPMGVHHAWGRTYKDLYNRYHAMLGKNLRWQNGFDCQGLWVEVEVEKELGFKSKRDIEAHGLAEFVNLCKQRVLKYAAVQTGQSIRLGYWMDWNSPDELRRLAAALAEDPNQPLTIQGSNGPVSGTAEQIVGLLGMPQVGGSYFTFSNENNYQIWNFLKKCDENGWLYKGHDVMPWCSRCGTGISQHEIVTDGYKDITHESVYVRFPLAGKPQHALLVWTTTPWTLTSNVAAAVGPELTYAQVQHEDGWTYYLAETTLKSSLIGKYEVVSTLNGRELAGWNYSGPFDELPAAQTAFSDGNYTHRVILWKDVSAEEGTGIVHIAPGCGAEDFGLSKIENLPVIGPLDESGYYLPGFDWLSGRSVHTVAEDIFESLRGKNVYYRKQKITHRYPHCWRCAQELVYRLVDEWYISMGELYDKPREEVTEAEKKASLRYQIMDVVDEIKWVPSFGYEREMDWLRNMHDWMISKKRYWGLALPIWVCETCGHFDVLGSEAELEERAIEGWDSFKGHTPHRPYIDAVKIACTSCGQTSKRIADVGNPWLDAGIVAFSTMNYANPEEWQKWFPADFITESFPGQFRNWFYSLLAQSTVLSNRPPFKNILGFATLFAEDGRAMHKSWGNSIEFNEAANTMGADVMRWLYACHQPEQNLLFGYTKGDETRRRFLIPLWNVYAFFISYASLDGWTPATAGSEPSPVAGNAQLDQWIIERLNETAVAVRQQMDNYTAHKATELIEALLDDLSNWYVRRSRRRFWKSEADTDKNAAYATLYHVLVEFTKLIAPFVPFVTEAMYQNLVRSHDSNAPASVHHCLYPNADESQLDGRLLDKMRLAITTASLGRSARSSADVKLRQPLGKARVNVGNQQAQDDLMELAEVLKEEMNVKELEVVSEVGELVNYKLQPNNRVLGPKLGTLFPKVRNALLALNPAEAARTLQSGQALTLTVDGQTVSLNDEDVLVQTEARGGLSVASDKGVTVAVDTTLTPELIHEGYSRDFVRLLNNLRKEAGLAISDRIEVQVVAPLEVALAMTAFASTIQQETLADSLAVVTAVDEGWTVAEVEVGETAVTLGVKKVS